MSTSLEQLSLAFPSRLREAACAAIARLPLARIAPSTHTIGPIRVDDEDLLIPARTYHPPVTPIQLGPGNDVEVAIAHCLYSRHHDGFVRQRHLECLLPITSTWQAPFILQPVGEYVVELIELLESSLDDASQSFLEPFVQANPEFITRTHQRALSYWNCYYRDRWSQPDQYPGMRVLNRLGARIGKRRPTYPKSAG